MKRIDGATAAPGGQFQGGSSALGYLDATIVTADWLNSLQEEIIAPITAAAIALDGSDRAQLLKALRRLFAQVGVGARQGPAAIKLGWTGDHLALTVDNVDAGDLVTVNSAAADAQNRADIALAAAKTYANGTLHDVPITGGTAGLATYQTWPNGSMTIIGKANTVTGNQDVVVFPVAFPSHVSGVVVTEGNAAGWGTSPVQPTIYGATAIPGNTGGFYVSSARITSSGSSYQGGLTFNYIAWGY